MCCTLDSFGQKSSRWLPDEVFHNNRMTGRGHCMNGSCVSVIGDRWSVPCNLNNCSLLCPLWRNTSPNPPIMSCALVIPLIRFSTRTRHLLGVSSLFVVGVWGLGCPVPKRLELFTIALDQIGEPKNFRQRERAECSSVEWTR